MKDNNELNNTSYFNVVNRKEEYIFNSSKTTDSLVFNKINNKITITDRTIDYKNKQKYFGIVGCIEGVEYDYLILISKIKKIGQIINSNIYLIEGVIID